MKKTSIIAVITVLLIALLALGAVYFIVKDKKNDNTKEINSQIENSLFPDDTDLGKAIRKNVSVKVVSTADESVTVRVNAPNVEEELIAWYDNADADGIGEEKIEETIFSLLKAGKKTEAEYSFDVINGEIVFTEEYLNHISCGIEGFYGYVLHSILIDMEKGAAE